MRYRLPNSGAPPPKKKIKGKKKQQKKPKGFTILNVPLEVLNSKIFDPSVPANHIKNGGRGEGRGASRDTKTSGFRYKRYPQKVSGYVTNFVKL